jgi:hypothetical protein
MRTKSGKVLSERDLEDLAREAEAGYDLTKARRRHVGRPSLGHGTSPRVQFRIEPDVYERAKQKAAGEARSLSDVGRELFTSYATTASKPPGRRTRHRRRTRS